MSEYKETLLKNLWDKNPSYYQSATSSEGTNNDLNPGLKSIRDLALGNIAKVLEVGCGAGEKLNFIVGNRSAVGVDVSKQAIDLAGAKFPHLSFLVADSEKLPFPDESFDLVYCAFVLEHLDNFEESILEMVRVTKKNGYTAFICPNYGSPNRVSPCNKGNLAYRILKLRAGFLMDLKILLLGFADLNWNKVTPLSLGNIGELHVMDWDTVCEPYIHSLSSYLQKKGLQLVTTSSLWELDLGYKRFPKSLIRVFGNAGIFPFKFWGPQLFLVLKK